MKTAIALRHIHFEDLGILSPLLRERGYRIDYLDATVDNLAQVTQSSCDLLVVLGGPIGAFDDEIYPFLPSELAVIAHRLQQGLPILGICLGAQLMARALGAKVYSMGKKEIGYGPLALTDEGRNSALAPLATAPVLHWHGDQFDIPAGAKRLAASPVCPNQAFSVGNNALGLQFHLEADPAFIERWLVGHASELAQASIAPGNLRQQARTFGPSLIPLATQAINQWMDGWER